MINPGDYFLSVDGDEKNDRNEGVLTERERAEALLEILLLHRATRLTVHDTDWFNQILGASTVVAALQEPTHGDDEIVKIGGLTSFSVAVVDGSGDTPKNGDFGASGAQVKNTDFGNFASCVSRDLVLCLRFKRMTFDGCSLQRFHYFSGQRNSDLGKPNFMRRRSVIVNDFDNINHL